MKNYKYFNFDNFVGVAVLDDGLFMEMLFFAKCLIASEQERQGQVREGGELAGSSRALSTDPIMRFQVFECTLKMLRHLVEDGLIVIGVPQHKKKTSFGHFEVEKPALSVEEMYAAIRKDYEEKGYEYIEVCWIVQATSKGWEWAQRIDREIPAEPYNLERKHFFTNKVD